MPEAWARACTWRNCPEVVRGKERLCETHKKQFQKSQTQENRNNNPQEQRFYNSPEWKTLSKNQRANEPYCRECLSNGKTKFGEVTDHMVPLKIAWHLRLNAINVQTLCHPCHNKKRVFEAKMYKTAPSHSACYIIAGPPGAGKTYYAKKNMRRGDVLVDLDAIFSSLSGLEQHDNPQSLLGLAINVRHAIFARLCLMGIDRPVTWIVGGFPTAEERKQLKNMFTNSKVIIMKTPKEICMDRIKLDKHRSTLAQWQYYKEVIDDWYEEFEPEGEEE